MLSVNSLTCAIPGSTWLEWDWEPSSSISSSNGTLSSRRTLTRCSRRPKLPTSAVTLVFFFSYHLILLPFLLNFLCSPTIAIAFIRLQISIAALIHLSSPPIGARFSCLTNIVSFFSATKI